MSKYKKRKHLKQNNPSAKGGSKGLNYLLAFVLAILITLAGYMLGSVFGVFNKNFVSKVIVKTEYCSKMHSSLIKDTIRQGKPLLIPDSVYDGIYSGDKIYEDVMNVLNAKVSKTEYKVNTEVIINKLDANIKKYAKDNGIDIGDKEEKILAQFYKFVESNYVTEVSIPYSEYYIGLRDLFDGYFWKIFVVCLIMIIIASVIIIVNNSYLHRALRYIVYSAESGAILVILPALFLLVQGIYRKLSISPVYIKDLLVGIIDSMLLSYVIVGVLIFALAGILISVIIILRKREENKSRLRRHNHHDKAKSEFMEFDDDMEGFN